MAKTYAYGHNHFPKDCGIQHGFVDVNPVANTPSCAHVDFETEYTEAPTVVVSGVSSVPGTTLYTVTASNISPSGFDAYVYRTNDTPTAVMWIAIGKMA